MITIDDVLDHYETMPHEDLSREQVLNIVRGLKDHCKTHVGKWTERQMKNLNDFVHDHIDGSELAATKNNRGLLINIFNNIRLSSDIHNIKAMHTAGLTKKILKFAEIVERDCRERCYFDNSNSWLNAGKQWNEWDNQIILMGGDPDNPVSKT